VAHRNPSAEVLRSLLIDANESGGDPLHIVVDPRVVPEPRLDARAGLNLKSRPRRLARADGVTALLDDVSVPVGIPRLRVQYVPAGTRIEEPPTERIAAFGRSFESHPAVWAAWASAASRARVPIATPAAIRIGQR
jgi:hypothetical protein